MNESRANRKEFERKFSPRSHLRQVNSVIAKWSMSFNFIRIIESITEAYSDCGDGLLIVRQSFLVVEVLKSSASAKKIVFLISSLRSRTD